jgi:CRISPR-associated protein Csx17
MTAHDVLLRGCQPEPLGHYLKALGLFRLVAEQVDPAARAFWTDAGFVLRSRLDEAGLETFLLDVYQPSPIVAPWNGGSGFYGADQALSIIRTSVSPRFRNYRIVVEACTSVVERLGLTSSPKDDSKQQLVETLRARLPDEALPWLDAALALTSDGIRYPPLLGTGGNDGRLDFTNNFMQRLVELFASGAAPSPAVLRQSLFGVPAPGLLGDVGIGQFCPAAAGGLNAGAGFTRDSVVNPWDFILLLEGTLLFATAQTRKLESASGPQSIFPFRVRTAGSGYASASQADESKSRDEMWLPIWQRPGTFFEVRAFFSEARTRLGRRPAVTGVDYARALVGLGAQRGVAAFTRFGFQERKGKAYIAVPLGRWGVAFQPSADLLAPLDRWLSGFRSEASGEHAAGGIKRALRRLDEAILALCSRGGPAATTTVLIELGQAEAALAATFAYQPLPLISADWLAAIDDGSCELRLAVALAASQCGDLVVPVRRGQHSAWLSRTGRGNAFADADLTSCLLAALRRLELEGHWSRPGRFGVAAADLAAYVDGAVDERRLEGLLRGLVAMDWAKALPLGATGTSSLPGGLHALMRLAREQPAPGGGRLPRTPGLLARGAAGDATAAARLAMRRLRAAGLPPRISALHETTERTRRATAALAFPVTPSTLARLALAYLQPVTQEPTDAHRNA